MSRPDDPLWSPGAGGDAELQRLERLLQRYRHVPSAPPPPVVQPALRLGRTRLPLRLAAVVAGIALLGTAAWLPWRLQWRADAPWSVVASGHGGGAVMLAPGERLVTGDGEQARIEVARIGVIEVSPRTRLALVATGPGRHRVALEQGHIRARIWAPAGYFGVRHGAAETIDLGCEFDLWQAADGSGRLTVRSGWVAHEVGAEETLVPEGHTLAFDAGRAGVPLRGDAAPPFRVDVTRLDAGLRAGRRDTALEHRIAAAARATDAHTLLALLTRHPSLADGPLYSRLAVLIGAPADDARHRAAWAAGGVHAINAWWDRIPRPPKQWWRNWRDALP